MIPHFKRFCCISDIKYSLAENIKCFGRCFTDLKGKVISRNLKTQMIRNKSRDISANLMYGAKKFRATNRKTKVLTKPIYYKGEILYGVHPVYLALFERKRHLFQLFIKLYKEASFSLEKAERIYKIEKLAKSLGIPVHKLDQLEMDYLAPGSIHQGVCLDVGPLLVPEWEDTKCTFENQESNLPVWLILNEVLDPMNVGAIIRSAHYFGINKLFVVKGSSCKLSPTVSKASSGALEVMNIYQIEKLEYFLQIKKTQGWNIISTVAYSEVSNQKTDITDFRISKPTILILGNEGKGISLEIQKLCDTLISIPPKNNLHPGIDSLNVSVAAGVILFSLSSRKDSH